MEYKCFDCGNKCRLTLSSNNGNPTSCIHESRDTLVKWVKPEPKYKLKIKDIQDVGKYGEAFAALFKYHGEILYVNSIIEDGTCCIYIPSRTIYYAAPFKWVEEVKPEIPRGLQAWEDLVREERNKSADLQLQINNGITSLRETKVSCIRDIKGFLNNIVNILQGKQ